MTILQAALDRIAAADSSHILGVAVTNVQTGSLIAALNPDRRFQLASMFKVPVLVAALRQVDAGQLGLTQRYSLAESHKLIGSGVLSYLNAGLQPTLHDLLTLMIIVSDNTATDMVLDLVGGISAVAAMLHDIEIDGIQLRHTTRDLLWAVFPSAELALSDAEIDIIIEAQNLVRRDVDVAPDAATNTGTPAALNTLLVCLERDELLTSATTDVMRTILLRQTYNQRLPARWPHAIPFAHKTGTLSAMRGDTGIAYFPDHTLAISAIAEAVDPSFPLPPEIQALGDDLLAQVGAAIYAWAMPD